MVQPNPGEDRDSVPLGFAVVGDLVPATVELSAEQLRKRVVRELGLLQAHHIGATLVQPG